MKKFLYFFLFLLCIVVGFLGVFVIRKYQVENAQKPIKNPISTAIPFSLNTPPKNALKGTITQQNGDIFWESRSATQSEKLTTTPQVLQGELFQTDDNASLAIAFSNIFTVSLAKNTSVSFIQTLPTNIVLLQQGGEVVYEKLEDHSPLTIRMNSLIIQLQKGTYTITYDDRRNQIMVQVTEGSAKLAFNDSDLLSTVVDLLKGDTYTFDIDSKTGETTSE